MEIETAITLRLKRIYADENRPLITAMAQMLTPDATAIAENFYGRLLALDEVRPVLENTIVRKNLPVKLRRWLLSMFQPMDPDEIPGLIARQRELGAVHANINIHFRFIGYGLQVIKSDLFQRIRKTFDEPDIRMDAAVLVVDLFDIAAGLISEAYFQSEMVHESNELSLKVKGIPQNSAIECERLRYMLMDWLRNTLTLLYQSPGIDPENLPKLQYSNFGLWVTYKSEFLGHHLNVSDTLKGHVRDIDEALFQAARRRAENRDHQFFQCVAALNDAVNKAAWFISSVVDQLMEMDNGMDPLTRLFNRRYLDTILRKQIEISLRQGFSFAVLMIDLDHFNTVNDIYGYDSGDMLLKQFAEILLLSVRASDFAFRHSGNRFMVIVGNADAENAVKIGEKIREKCRGTRFQAAGGQTAHITCSVGVAAFDNHPDYRRLIKMAEKALFKAKSEGKDRVERLEDGSTSR